MKDQLENQQYFCEVLRKQAPNHTYKNDREIIESMRAILDLNMQIPSTDERFLIDLLHWKGLLEFQQCLLRMVTEAYPRTAHSAGD
jgi:dissimilatory sulfite reductase (desulfoviridin) alpha/beta subunit